MSRQSRHARSAVFSTRLLKRTRSAIWWRSSMILEHQALRLPLALSTRRCSTVRIGWKYQHDANAAPRMSRRSLADRCTRWLTISA
jgi:hypothetical protein